MTSARVKSLISGLDSVVYCTDCVPPIAVEIRANVFYRLQDHDLVSCPNGHRGTLRDYKYAAANPGEKSGPFVLQQPGGVGLRLVGKAR